MKKIFIPVIISAIALLASCNPNRLEIEQKAVVSTETFYKTDADAESAMVAAYQGFLWNICSREGGSIYAPFRACFNNCADDFYAAGEFFGDNDFMAAMNEFRYDSSSEVIRNCYNNIYYAMYYSNLVIEHFKDGLPDGTKTATTKRVVAEARVLRAYMHMMLAIGWENPPLVDHLLTGSENPYNCDADQMGEKKLTHNQLLEWCAKECETAVEDLDERKDPTDKDGSVKVTKGFANAVAGKAYLFAGKYNEAKTALKKVIDSKKYELVPGVNYADNFHIEGDCNAEKIFEANLEINSSISVWWDIVNRSTWMEANIWNWRSDHFVANPSSSYSSIDGWGGSGVPQAFADKFIANDGLNSYRLKATIINIDDVVYNTVYGDGIGIKDDQGKIIKKADDMTLDEKKATGVLGLDARGLYGQSFWLPLKPVCKVTDLVGPGQNQRLNNFTIMRYAEVLLMYAECQAILGDDGTGLKAITDIQNRAGSKTVSTQLTLDVVKSEKQFEMWLEGCRFADCVRWGDFDGMKNAGKNVTNLYDKITRAPKSDDVNVVWENGTEANSRFYTVSTHAALDRGDKIGFVEGKHNYFPFPFNAIQVNPNLKQHSGWE